MAADHSLARTIGRQVDEVVADDQVARVEQVVQAAYAGVGKDPLDAGAVQHAEDLTRGQPARYTRSPPVHTHVQHGLVAQHE
jgi:predicted dinucleotide-binding enzyme